MYRLGITDHGSTTILTMPTFEAATRRWRDLVDAEDVSMDADIWIETGEGTVIARSPGRSV